MSAMPDTTDDHFSLLELDDVPSNRRTPAPELPSEPLRLDLVDDVRHTVCLSCNKPSEACASVTADADVDFGAEPTAQHSEPGDLVTALGSIAAQGVSNAVVQGAGSMAGGQLAGVGFTTREGYITAIRNGVRNATYQGYLQTLRTQYGMTTADINALGLPGPMAETVLPNGAGIKHTPTGPSVFDRPRAERAFVVGPKETPVERVDVALKSTDLVAGAVAEGHHAIVAWEGTSGTTRGALMEALTSIERQGWAPKAPNARAQAGSAIASLSSAGLLVRAMRKGEESGLATGEHVWTCGLVNHTGQVGQQFGQVTLRFKLSGAVLSFEGPANVGAAVVANFEGRMAAELFKSSDVTGWLSRTVRWRLDGVRFGALGWLVPARNVAAAKQLCEAVQAAGFGGGWVTGLPVATSDQLRDGIANGLVDEVLETHNRIRAERATVVAARDAAIATAASMAPCKERFDAAASAHGMPQDIGKTRAESMLKELRAIGGRVVAYGQILGEQRVERAQRTIRDAIVELEGIAGDDYSGISARFSAVWDEIELDRKRTGGVL